MKIVKVSNQHALYLFVVPLPPHQYNTVLVRRT